MKVPQKIRVSVLFVFGFLILLLYLALGAVSLPLNETIQCLVDLVLHGENYVRQEYPRTSAILLHIRIPRSIAAILSGGALALSGAAMQGLFKNPMASPDVMGISAGASLGAVLGITLGVAVYHPLMVPIFSIVGALLTATFVFVLAGRGGAMQLLFVILAGLAISSLLGGAVSAILLFSQEYEVSQFIFWTMGGLEGRMWQHILWPAPFILIFSYLTFRLGKPLNLLSIGEENAHGMGLDVRSTKIQVLVYTSVLTSLAISISGPIGFIALMVPHLVRLIFGPDHRILLPLSMYVGAMFVLLSDLLGRWLISPHEIKVGIITSILGGTYFVFLIIRYQRMGRLV